MKSCFKEFYSFLSMRAIFFCEFMLISIVLDFFFVFSLLRENCSVGLTSQLNFAMCSARQLLDAPGLMVRVFLLNIN